MENKTEFDVIIIGGSYSGLAAAMALGRALRNILIIKPCNKQTPHSHNFLTQDGKSPAEIASIGKQQVLKYNTVTFLEDLATDGKKDASNFVVTTKSGKSFIAKRLVFATGIKDSMPEIPGFAECWGISVLHCPYCHGYEVRHLPTGIFGNGDFGFEFSGLISNWTNDLALFTDGTSTLTKEETTKLAKHGIPIIEKEIAHFEHENEYLNKILFKDGTSREVKAIYARLPFEQHCQIPESLGCEINEDGYLSVNPRQQTSIPGIYACGDNTTRMRTVANAISMGTTAGMMLNKEFVLQDF